MELLLEFEYGNKWYGVVKDGDKIKNCVIKRDNYDFSLSKEENKLINAVLDNFIPSDKRIDLMDYEYGGKNYQVFLDPKTNIRHFSPRPNDIDLYELNMIFNNMDDCVYADENNINTKKEDKSKKIKRTIKLGSKIIVTYVSVYLFLVGAGFTIDNYFINKRNESLAYTQSLSNEEISGIINNSILKNQNLSEEEKEKLLTVLHNKIFLENRDYMDIKYIEDILTNIRMRYHRSKARWSGSYNYRFNVISFYGVNDLSEVNNTTFAHEVYHALQKINFVGFNRFLVETTNTIFTEEYDNKDENIYVNYYNFTKALMEIVGSEPLQHYHNYTSTDLIVNELVKITGSRDDAKRLLANLDDYKKLYDRIAGNIGGIDIEKQNLAKLEDKIMKTLEKYYYAKYNISMDDDLVMLYYLKPKELNKVLNDIISPAYSLTWGSNYTFQNNKKYFIGNNDGSIDVYALKVYSLHEEENKSTYKTYDYQSGKIFTEIAWREATDSDWEKSISLVDMTEEERNSPICIFHINNSNRYINRSLIELGDNDALTSSNKRTI